MVLGLSLERGVGDNRRACTRLWYCNDGTHSAVLAGSWCIRRVLGGHYLSSSSQPTSRRAKRQTINSVGEYGTSSAPQAVGSGGGEHLRGDAGQNEFEEIDYQPVSSKGGQNYGWAIYEGNSCYVGGSACSTGGLTPPVTTYTHAGGNCVVVGGYDSRGQKYPSLTGAYFYGDGCSGRIWSFPAADARDGHVATQQILDTQLSISSFGEDATGELYVVSLDGSISRVTE